MLYRVKHQLPSWSCSHGRSSSQLKSSGKVTEETYVQAGLSPFQSLLLSREGTRVPLCLQVSFQFHWGVSSILGSDVLRVPGSICNITAGGNLREAILPIFGSLPTSSVVCLVPKHPQQPPVWLPVVGLLFAPSVPLEHTLVSLPALVPASALVLKSALAPWQINTGPTSEEQLQPIMVSDSEAVSSQLRPCLVLDVPQPILNQSYSHTISLLGKHAQTLHHLFGSGDSQSYGDDNGGDWEEFQSQPAPYTCQILDILGILN